MLNRALLCHHLKLSLLTLELRALLLETLSVNTAELILEEGSPPTAQASTPPSSTYLAILSSTLLRFSSSLSSSGLVMAGPTTRRISDCASS